MNSSTRFILLWLITFLSQRQNRNTKSNIYKNIKVLFRAKDNRRENEVAIPLFSTKVPIYPPPHHYLFYNPFFHCLN